MSDSEELHSETFTDEVEAVPQSEEAETVWNSAATDESEGEVCDEDECEKVLTLEEMEGHEDEIELVESEDGSGEIDLSDHAEEDALLLEMVESPEVDPDFDPEATEAEQVEGDQDSEPSAECIDHELCKKFASECHDLLCLRGLVPQKNKRASVAALCEAICDTYSE